MPWQEIKPMEKRLEFALRAQRCENFRALCREYEISPRVGYKWKKRLVFPRKSGLRERSCIGFSLVDVFCFGSSE
jgi:hypothetical protein